MARIRTIKPQHCADKELPNISLQAHLLWVLNWCFSDDSGVFENDPFLIKSNLFPRRQDVRTEQINQWLGQLAKARYIIPFTHNGVSYYINRTFGEHQKIDRPQPSKIPQEVIRRLLDEYSTNVQPCIVRDSKVEVKEEESKAAPPSKSTLAEKFTPDQVVSFDNFQKWLSTEAPNVAKMKNPFTIDQYLILAKEFKADVIKDLIMKMDNWADLNKKNLYAYKTFRNWAGREFNKAGGVKDDSSTTEEKIKQAFDVSKH